MRSGAQPEQRRPGGAAEDQERDGGRVPPCHRPVVRMRGADRIAACAAPARHDAPSSVASDGCRHATSGLPGAPRRLRPCRRAAPRWQGRPSRCRGAAPAGCGASVRSAAAAAGRRAPYGLAAGAQAAAAAHTTATPPTASDGRDKLGHQPAARSGASTSWREQHRDALQGFAPPRGSKGGNRARGYTSPARPPPRAARESISVSGIPRRTIPSEHASGGTSAALSRRLNG